MDNSSRIKIMISFISTGLTIRVNSYGYYRAKEDENKINCRGIFLPFTISLFSFHVIISFFHISCLCRKNINNNFKLQAIENIIISILFNRHLY